MPGGAEAALQRMVATEGRLQDREPVRRGRQSLDGANIATLGLHRERQAGARRHAVDGDRAGAADPVLAADMRARRADLMAQRVGEQHARLDLDRDGRPLRVKRTGCRARRRSVAA